jgi:hypothetical protein
MVFNHGRGYGSVEAESTYLAKERRVLVTNMQTASGFKGKSSATKGWEKVVFRIRQGTVACMR